MVVPVFLSSSPGSGSSNRPLGWGRDPYTVHFRRQTSRRGWWQHCEGRRKREEWAWGREPVGDAPAHWGCSRMCPMPTTMARIRGSWQPELPPAAPSWHEQLTLRVPSPFSKNGQGINQGRKAVLALKRLSKFSPKWHQIILQPVCRQHLHSSSYS